MRYSVIRANNVPHLGCIVDHVHSVVLHLRSIMPFDPQFPIAPQHRISYCTRCIISFLTHFICEHCSTSRTCCCVGRKSFGELELR